MWQKLWRDFLGHYKSDKIKTLHDGSPHWTLSLHVILSDLDFISRSQHCQTISSENFMLLSSWFETLYDCWLHQVEHEHTTIFDFCTCSREIIGILPCFQGGERWKDSHNYYLQPRRARNQMHGGYCPVDFVVRVFWDDACLSLSEENHATPSVPSDIISCAHVSSRSGLLSLISPMSCSLHTQTV